MKIPDAEPDFMGKTDASEICLWHSLILPPVADISSIIF